MRHAAYRKHPTRRPQYRAGSTKEAYSTSTERHRQGALVGGMQDRSDGRHVLGWRVKEVFTFAFLKLHHCSCLANPFSYQLDLFVYFTRKYGICLSVIVIVMTEAAERGGVGNWCLGRIILLLVLALLALSSDHTASAIGASIVGMRWE